MISTRALRLASFSSCGVPSAMTLPWSMTTMRVGQRVGLLEVLGGEQHGDPVAEQLPDGVPHLLPTGRIEPGGRLVEEEHRWTGHHARREVDPPSHAARVSLHDPVGGIDQVESFEQFARSGTRLASAHVAQLADQHQVLPAGEEPVQGGVLGGDADPASHLGRVRHDVDAGHPWPVPASGRARVVRIRTAVVFPAPFGPSSPRTVPAGTAKSTPPRASVSPYLLTRPSASIIVSGIRIHLSASTHLLAAW